MFLIPTKLQVFKFNPYKKFIHFWSLFAFCRDYFGVLKISIFYKKFSKYGLVLYTTILWRTKITIKIL